MKTIWTTRTTYIDTETGEIISKEVAERDYIVIKIESKRKHNNNEYNPKGVVERTVKLRRSNQTRIWDTDI